MKHILTFTLLLFTFSVFAQYPATPTTKQELGRQTTGDGLIFRGSGAPNYTPTNNRNAWIYYDTTNNRLFKSRLGSWSLMIQDTSAFNEIQMPYIIDDTLYLTQNVTGEPLTRYVNRVWPIAALSDTTTITGENQGDVAFVTGGTAVAFRGSAYWNPFSGGGGGSFTSFTLAGTSGTPQTITDGNTATIAAGTGITTTAGATDQVTVALANTAVTPGSYGSATQVPGYTVDAQGRLTAASNTSIQIAQSQVTGLADSLSSAPSGTGTNLRIPVWTGSATLGSSTLLQSAAGLTLDANLAFRLTGGTTASRPTGAAGMSYYNTSNNWFDLHNGTSWFNPLRSATATGLGTAGRVFYAGSAGTAAADDLFTWDATNNFLGINVATPLMPLHLESGTTAGGLGFATIAGMTGPSLIAANTGLNDVTGKSFFFTSAYTVFRTLAASGGVLIGSINNEVIPTARLQVRGQGATSATKTLIVENSAALNAITILDDATVGIGTGSPDRKLHSELSGSATNTAGLPLRLSHITSGTAAAGFGTGMEFEAENASGTNRVIGQTEAVYTTATNAAEVSDLVFRTMRAGTLTEALRSKGDGTLRPATLTGTATKLVGATSDNTLTSIAATITTAGTTGNVTINALAGTVNIAAAGTTVTVTNSNVTANSLVFCTLRTNDATATVKNVVPGVGSFVINLGAAATGEVSIGFFVVN